MKKVLLLLVIIAFVSCKNESKAESENPDNTEKTEKQSDGLTLIKGEFIYIDDAAVLQTNSEMYGVIINDKMHELNEQAKKYKTAATDMVQVEIRGKITTEKHDDILWPNKVEIIEILKVSKPNPEGGEMITIGKD